MVIGPLITDYRSGRSFDIFLQVFLWYGKMKKRKKKAERKIDQNEFLNRSVNCGPFDCLMQSMTLFNNVFCKGVVSGYTYFFVHCLFSLV